GAVAVRSLPSFPTRRSSDLKPAAALGDGRFLPRRISLEHYRAALGDPQFPAALANSIGVAGLATLLGVALASLAAYAIVRLEFPDRKSTRLNSRHVKISYAV